MSDRRVRELQERLAGMGYPLALGLCLWAVIARYIYCVFKIATTPSVCFGERRVIQTFYFCKLLQRHHLPLMRNAVGDASVQRLKSSCSPTAVARLIPFVVVDAVYRATWRNVAHIREKILKAAQPALAHGNSSTPTQVPVPGLGVCASFFGVSIGKKRRALFASRAVPVSALRLSDKFTPKAAATFGVSATQFASRNDLFSAAFARTKPKISANLALVKPNGCQPSEYLSGCHGWFSLHGLTLQEKQHWRS